MAVQRRFHALLSLSHVMGGAETEPSARGLDPARCSMTTRVVTGCRRARLRSTRLRFARWLLRKGAVLALGACWRCVDRQGDARRCGRATPLDGCERQTVAVQLQEVVGGRDQPPFRPARRSSTALKAVDPSVELRVREDWLDCPLAFSVDRRPELGRKYAAHERVVAAVPTRPWCPALVGVGWDLDLGSAADDRLHLRLVPVAGVGDNHLRLLGDARRLQLALRGAGHRPQVSEVG